MLVIDHARSVKDGGPSSEDNLVAACQECNSGKSATSVDVIALAHAATAIQPAVVAVSAPDAAKPRAEPRAKRHLLEDVEPNAKTHMLCWNPGSAEVALIPWPDFRNLSEPYSRSSLAAFSDLHDMDFSERRAKVFVEALHLIVRDGCEPAAVHRALSALAEYRDGCADDMPGIYRLRLTMGER